MSKLFRVIVLLLVSVNVNAEKCEGSSAKIILNKKISLERINSHLNKLAVSTPNGEFIYIVDDDIGGLSMTEAQLLKSKTIIINAKSMYGAYFGVDGEKKNEEGF